jgi:hypothetical protein
VDREGLCDTDSVGQLNQNSSSESSSDKGLGDPSSSVGGRSIDLGPIFTRESTTTVSTPTTVGVDNDLSTSQTSITLRSTNNESTRRLNVVNTLVVEQVLGDNLLDNLFHDFRSEVFGRDLLGVLGRNDNSVDSDGDDGTVSFLSVLDSDLGLGIGSEPSQRSISSSSSHGGIELVGKHDGQRHHLGGLVGSVTEPIHQLKSWKSCGRMLNLHDTLITSTGVFEVPVVKTLGDFSRLLLDSNKDVTGLVVETLVRVVVTDLLDGVSDDLLVIDRTLERDLSEDLDVSSVRLHEVELAHHDHTGLGGSFTGDLDVSFCSIPGALKLDILVQRGPGRQHSTIRKGGQTHLLETSIEDSIRDLITDLVGVTLSDRLGSEEEAACQSLYEGTPYRERVHGITEPSHGSMA